MLRLQVPVGFTVALFAIINIQNGRSSAAETEELLEELAKSDGYSEKDTPLLEGAFEPSETQMAGIMAPPPASAPTTDECPSSSSG